MGFKLVKRLFFFTYCLFISACIKAQSTKVTEMLNHTSDSASYLRFINFYNHATLSDSTTISNMLHEALAWANANDDKDLTATIKLYKSYLYLVKRPNDARIGTNKNYFTEANKGLQYALENNNQIIQGLFYINIAIIHGVEKNHILAYEHFIKGFDLLEKAGYDKVPYISSMCVYYANYLFLMRDYKEALRILQIGEKYMGEQDEFCQFQIPNTIALCYNKLKQYQNSITYHLKALAFYKKVNNIAWIAISSSNLADVYISLKQYDKALTCLLPLRDLAYDKVYLYTHAEFEARIAQCYIGLSNYSEANKVLKKIEPLVAKEGDLSTKKNYALQLSYYYKFINDNANYLKYQQQFYILKDSIYNQAFNDNYIADRVKLEAERNFEKIKRINADKKNAEQNRNIIILVLLFIALCITVFFNYKRIKYKQTQLELTISNQLLEQEKRAQETELKNAEQSLQQFTLNLIEKTKLIEQIQLELSKTKEDSPILKTEQDIEKINQLTQLTILTEEDWEHFKKLFESAFPNYLTSLLVKYPALTKAEIRLITLSKLNLSIKDIANMLAISPESVRRTKYRLRDKLALTGDDLTDLFS